MPVSSIEAKEEHNKLFLRLNETFSPESLNFNALQRAARPYLQQGTVEQCKNIDELAEKLQQGGFIKIGDYTKLKLMIQNAKCDVDEIIEIIKDTENRINKLEVQHALGQSTSELLGKRSESSPQHNCVANQESSVSKWRNLTTSQSANFETSLHLTTTSTSAIILDHTGTIQRELQDWYIDTLSRLRPIPWCDWLEVDLDHVFTNLVMVPGTKDQLCPRSNVDCDDITMFNRLFNADSSKRSVSFIEGPAGIGKSTLCRHLAYLWSKNNYSISDHSFDLLFLLEAKSLTGDLKKSMNEQLFPKDFDLSEDNIYECIRDGHKKCLLIIDGIDELSSEGKTTVMELLKGKKLRHVNFLLTGRPEGSMEFIKYAKSHLQITGFSFENIKEYICKYFGSNDNKYKDMLLDRLDVDDELQNIMENPFTTLLVCILVKDKKGDIPANLIDILNLVLQARCQNYVTKQEGNSNLISEDNLLSAAGHLACEGLKHGITAYPEDTLASFCPDGFSGHLLKSGILSKDFTVSRLHMKKGFCYFPHKSFQEFLCAKHLAELDLEAFKETLQPLFCLNLNANMLRFFLRIVQCQVKTQLLLEFICQNIKRLRPTGMFDWLTFNWLMDSCQNEDLLAQSIYTYSVSLRLYMFKLSFMFARSEEILTKIILKMKLPPVVVFSDNRSILMHLESDADKSLSVLKLTQKLPFSRERIMQFPHHLELNAVIPLFSYELVMLDFSWSFVHCSSIYNANDVLTRGAKVGVLTILLAPGCDSIKDTTALINSLTSAKNIASVLFLVVEDVVSDYEDPFLTMATLFSSLQNMSFLKLRSTRVNRKVVSKDTLSRHEDFKDVWCHVFDSSIIQMIYSKYCPY